MLATDEQYFMGIWEDLISTLNTHSFLAPSVHYRKVMLMTHDFQYGVGHLILMGDVMVYNQPYDVRPWLSARDLTV